MPMLIKHIDAIAREKQRDVLYILFSLNKAGQRKMQFDWKRDPMRKKVCQWLTEQQIPWQCCGHFARENMMMSYQVDIYLDIPFDDNDPQYQEVRDYLENPDGSMRFKTVTFCYLPLEQAMQNAHHDEPGFWERWAETF